VQDTTTPVTIKKESGLRRMTTSARKRLLDRRIRKVQEKTVREHHAQREQGQKDTQTAQRDVFAHHAERVREGLEEVRRGIRPDASARFPDHDVMLDSGLEESKAAEEQYDAEARLLAEGTVVRKKKGLLERIFRKK